MFQCWSITNVHSCITRWSNTYAHEIPTHTHASSSEVCFCVGFCSLNCCVQQSHAIPTVDWLFLKTPVRVVIRCTKNNIGWNEKQQSWRILARFSCVRIKICFCLSTKVLVNNAEKILYSLWLWNINFLLWNKIYYICFDHKYIHRIGWKYWHIDKNVQILALFSCGWIWILFFFRDKCPCFIYQ